MHHPLDHATPRNPRILLLTQFFPADPTRSVFGAYQRLALHLAALERLGPVDIVFLWPPGTLSEIDLPKCREIAKQVWPIRGFVHFVACGDEDGLAQRISDAFWTLRGFVGFDRDAPSMDLCRHRQIEQIERILEISQPALVFAHRLSAAVPFLRMKSKLPPMFVDFDDVESVRIIRSAMSKPDRLGRWKGQFGGRIARRVEHRTAEAAAGVLVCSELEQRKVQAMCPGARVFVIPNTATSLGVLPSPAKPIVAFVGTAIYPPNAEAILWLAKEIWPHIHSAVPQARLFVVGEGTAELGIDSEQLGIEALGFIEDLTPIYAAAMLAVCPIRRGSGTRIKIIEAAMNGRPVVSTTVGAEGLTFKQETEIMIEDDAKGFANACIELLSDPARASRIGKAASERARSAYRAERIVEDLLSICAKAL